MDRLDKLNELLDNTVRKSHLIKAELSIQQRALKFANARIHILENELNNNTARIKSIVKQIEKPNRFNTI